MAISRLSIIKFVELALTCSCVALHYHSYNAEVDIGMLVTGTFIGYLIIFAGAAAGLVKGVVENALIVSSSERKAKFNSRQVLGLNDEDGDEGYVMQTATHKRVDIFYSLLGVALFVASGAVIIDRFQHYGKSDLRDKNLAKASLSIINGAVLLIDAVLTQRGG